MSDQRPDRRVRRTKRRLKEALLELIDERDYDGITIRDITDRADVGRSTFYSHFSSKEDLLFSGFDRWLLSLAESAPPESCGDEPDRDHPAPFRFSLPLLRHIRSQKRFFQATIVRGSNVRIRRRTTALLTRLVRLEMERSSRSASGARREEAVEGADIERLRDAHAHGVVGAFLGLVSWWLDAGEGLSAEVVDRVFQRLVTNRELTAVGGSEKRS